MRLLLKAVLPLLWAAPALWAQPQDVKAAVESYLAAADSPAGSKWEFEAILYLWAAGVDGTQTVRGQQVAVDASFSDLVENLEGALMFQLEASKGRFGLLVNLEWMKLGDEVPGPLGGTIDADLESLFVVVGGRYRFLDVERAPGRAVTGDVLAGVRWTDLDLKIESSGGPSTGDNVDWIDPFLGVRTRVDLSQKWSFLARADIAGSSSGSDMTWQAFFGFAYAFSERVSATIGYRWLDVDIAEGSGASRSGLDVRFDGPVLGMVIRF
jgi:opacity protein-like surface antigen